MPAGSVRVASTVASNLHNVAFVDPTGKKVLIVVNDNDDAKTFGIKFNGKTAAASLSAGAVATYVW